MPNSPTTRSAAARDDADIVYPAAVPFALVHLGCLAVVWTGVTWRAAAICVALYWLRMFGIGAGFHRYFSHRAFSTSRGFQFVLAWLAQTTAQNSVLWWAAKHRDHHLYSDTEDDTHSPHRRGFVYSHLGWIFDRKHAGTDYTRVTDLSRFPELRWLAKYEHVPAASLAMLCFLLAGWSGLVVGFLWSTVLVYHGTFCINSLAHTHGKRRYVTGDHSRNNLLLAFFTMGEGWHNNHHAYQSSARQGFRWWEFDATYYVLRGLQAIGVVWDLKAPPAEVVRNEHRLGGRVVRRAAEQLCALFDPARLAAEIAATVPGPALSALAAELTCPLPILDLPRPLPSREALARSARAMFPAGRPLDEIVDAAARLLSGAVGARLSGLVAPVAA